MARNIEMEKIESKDYDKLYWMKGFTEIGREQPIDVEWLSNSLIVRNSALGLLYMYICIFKWKMDALFHWILVAWSRNEDVSNSELVMVYADEQ